MYRLKKMFSILLSVLMLVLMPFTDYLTITSYADDSITASNPLLMPLTGWLTAVAIGTGIIGKNASESADQLISNVANNLKEKEIQKSLEDENYNSPFRVISGGSDKTPQKPNNNNKNGAWFALGAATAAASPMLFEKDAVEEAMKGFNEFKAYQKFVSELGVESADTMLNTANASSIALQLANISNSAVKQFDDFLHSSWFEDKGLNYNDCLFSVGVNVTQIIAANPKYPRLIINVLDNSQKNIKKVQLTSNPFGYYTYKNSYGELSYYYSIKSSNGIGTECRLLDENNVPVSVKYYRVGVADRTFDQSFNIDSNGGSGQNTEYYVNNFQSSPSNTKAYCGYKWTIENPWGLTNNVYNVNQTFEVNFPDWQQGIMEILGQQLQGVQIGGITQPSVTWEPTQQEIQSSPVPQNVITQYINNYQNPESIPEEEINPNPDPNPDPNPNPEADNEYKPDSTFLDSFMLPTLITNKFPFCIPFDVARALSLFDTNQREAPVWECDLHYGSNVYHMVIDLSQFNDIAAFLRSLEFILFIVGLAVCTRSIIRG